MCEIKAFLLKNGREEKVMESVEKVESTSKGILLKNIFGEEKSIKGRFVLLDTGQSRILLEPYE